MALTRITKGVIKPNENFDTHNIHSTGIVTAIGLDVNGNADISGNMSVGGVLTYEDVTSVDSVGIITAQKDIHVGAGLSVVGVSTFNGAINFNDDVTFTGANYNAVWDKSNNRFQFDADAQLRFQGSSFKIYNDGSGTSFIRNTATNLRITSDIFRVRKNNDSTHYINCASNSVKLYYGGSNKLETTEKGIQVGTGVTIESNGQAEIAGITTFYKDVHIKSGTNRLYLGTGNQLSLIADPSHSYLRNAGSGSHFQIHSNNFSVRSYDGNGSVILFYSPLTNGNEGGGPRLYHYHGAGHTYERLRTTKSGVNIVGTTTTTQLAVTGVSTFSGTLHFPDAVSGISTTNAGVAKFGNSGDLIIGHDGSNSRIRAHGAGSLILSNNTGIRLQNSSTNHPLLVAIPNGSVSLYNANSKKLETTSTGVDITGTLNVSDVVGITSSLNVTGITSISSQYSPQPFTVIGGSHPTPGYHYRNQFVFKTSHGHTDLKFENSYGGNWHGGSVSHTRILWEAYGERNGSVPGGDYGRLGEFCSIQPMNSTPGAFGYLNFKGNDGVVGLATMMRMYPYQQQLCVKGQTTLQVDQVGLGITANIYHLNDFNSGYTAYDTYFGFPQNNQFHLVCNGTEKFRVDSNWARFKNLSQGLIINSNVDLNGDIDVDGHTNLDNVNIAGVTTFSSYVLSQGTSNRGGIFGQLEVGYDSTYLTIQPTSGHNDLHLNFDNGSTVQIGHNSPTTLKVNGDIVPKTDGARDLGLTGTRFRAAYVDTYYGDGSNLTGVQGVPTGCILIWSGAANAIPSGFVLCDGSNSTPDLRNKFVVGASNSSGDTTYPGVSPGATGGSADAVTVSHSHNHNLSGNTNNTGNHSHNISGNSNNTGGHSHNRDKWGGNFGGSSGATVFRSDANGNRSTNNAGSHSHTISGNSNNTGAHSHNVSISGNVASNGVSGTNKNLPPYYALCYIMKT